MQKQKIKEIKRVRVSSQNLAIGMYVAELDIPWESSPFVLQGFSITSSRVLSKLQAICEYVYIDSLKSVGQDSKLRQAQQQQTKVSVKGDGPYRASKKPLAVNNSRYQKSIRLSDSEVKLANKSYKNVQNSIRNIYSSVSEGSSVDTATINRASTTLVNSAIRYPSALSWLALIQKHDNRIYDHAMRASTWALLCGRHIGLKEADLKWLSLGILLKDIGQLIAKTKQQETGTIVGTNEQLNQTLALFQHTKLNEQVKNIIRHHKEKFNGTGKPKGIAGEKIPLLARIAAIATAYDLALSPINPKRTPMSPSEAASLIYGQRGRAFQDELAVQFIEALGTYPLGTLLQMDSGETAIVVDHDEKYRLKPKIMIITDADGNEVKQKPVIALSNDKEMSSMKISRDVSSANINVDIEKIQKLYQEYSKRNKKTPMNALTRFIKRFSSTG